MWLFLVNLATSFLGWYSGSPMAKQIVNTVVQDLKEEGQRILPIAVDAIKSVAGDSNLSGKEKFNQVVNTVVDETEKVPASLVNSLVDLTYRTLKKDPNTPEVQ